MQQAGNEKILGGLGALFIILGLVPYIGWILWISGFVLLIISLNKFSKIFQNQDIFKKFLTGVLISVVGSVIFVIFGAISIVPILSHHGEIGNFPTIGMIFVLLAAYVLTIVSCYYFRESFKLLHQYTSVNLFKLAGNFIFWGAVGLIIFGIGAIAIIVGWIMLAVAFFTLQSDYKYE